MKRSYLSLVLLFSLIVLTLFGTAQPPAAARGPLQPALQGTPDSGEISIDPVTTPPATQPPGVTKKPPAGTAQPKFTPPATLEDLVKQYPDLQAYLDKVKDVKLADMDMAELYKRIVQIFKDKGASGVATFLKDSGILDKLNIPLAYLDLLVEYDKGGLDAVVKLAKDRKVISLKNELMGYMMIDDKANLGPVTEAYKTLGVSIYGFNENSDELEIGIPLEVLSQYQTPGALLGYLTKIANVEHVVGFRPPMPISHDGVPAAGKEGIAAKRIGADKWHAAGITGKGVKVGIIDSFSGIKAHLGTDLPENVNVLGSIDDLDTSSDPHGTAVAIMVHQIAPDAELYLAQHDFADDKTFTDALQYMQDNQVKAVNFSGGWWIGPRDGTFYYSVLVEQFIQDTGIMWVNAAGNLGDTHTMFKFADNGKGFHTFDPNDPKAVGLPFRALSASTAVILNWNGNWAGKEKNEYDFTVLDKDGNEVATAAEPKKGKKGDYPYQALSVDTTPGDDYFVVFKKIKGGNNNLDVFIPNGALPDFALVPGYSVMEPADAESAVSVGAVTLNKDDLEVYSSQGPTLDGRIKPDVTAPDCEPDTITEYNDGGFCGTSAASPVTMGAAALIWEKFPDMTGPEVKAFLMSHVKDLGKKGLDPQFGAGRLSLGDPAKLDAENPPKNTDPENPGDATPMPANPSDLPTATITSTNVKFNQTYKGQKSVKVTVSFNVDNFKGRKGVVAILFYDKATNQQVPTDDEKYTIVNGLGTGLTFTTKTQASSFEDVPMYIPNSAFSKLGSGTKALYYLIIIADVTDKNNAQMLASSDKVDIKFKK